jgi:choline dehydrogenase-like flavoprotein
MRVTFKNHPDDVKTMQFLLDRQMEILDAAGAQRKWAYPVTDTSPGAEHLLGTCRMGTDPKRSVIDPEHRTHDVPNLFLVDGSSFVTSGRNQPTCTIQALAYRAAERLAHAARRGEV